jgi:hypothetical protein
MDRAAEYFGLEVAFAAFVVLFILSRVIMRSALKLLGDDSKLKLVDASSRSIWWYLPLVALLILIFVHFESGIVGLILYIVAGIAYNIRWALQNQFPKPYVARIAIANGMILAGFTILAFGYAIEWWALDAMLQ